MKGSWYLVALAALTFVACSSKEEAGAKPEGEATEQTTNDNANASGATSSETSAAPVERTESGDADVEQFLKDYEAMVDQYVEVMKKVKSGDMSVAAEGQELQQKAMALQAKATEMSTKFTPADAERLQQILQKMTQVQ